MKNKKNNIIKFACAIILLLPILTFSQRSDPNLLSIGYHTGNRVGISFYNDGQIAGFNTGVDIRGEWPLGSGENYIGDCIPLIGVEFVNNLGDTLHSVQISRGPRRGQFDERHPTLNYRWAWNPVPGFRNPNYPSVAMSHLPGSWPIEGWNDPVAGTWKDSDGKTQWYGYFGRGIMNADQESFFEADDQWDDEFNGNFKPDATDLTRNGMALVLRQRGLQWSSFLAEDAIFWLYEIKNDGTTIYRKANFGTVVGTLAGGDGDSQDDMADFDPNDWITYSYDSDNKGNIGQKVGWVGYAFLESPGNPYDGIDNDNDSEDPISPTFEQNDFLAVIYDATSADVRKNTVILIDPTTYERTKYKLNGPIDTVYSLGKRYIIQSGVTVLREGHIASYSGDVAIPDVTANDGVDNDLDGLIDENEATHYQARIKKGYPTGVRYVNYWTGDGLNDLLIDERRDNDIDEDGDWNPLFDDVGTDGLGPNDDDYPGPDPDGTEGNGKPDQGEPNFGITDPDESDQIGLTCFDFFELTAAPDLSQDENLWQRMLPGRFDLVDPTPMDGDFIYGSGYFPLLPDNIERFSTSLLFGEDKRDVTNNKKIVQQIYNSNYKFPQAPRKPTLYLTQEDGKVKLYWDGSLSENSRDFITKTYDFQGYKIYRSTDANFRDSRLITNALGVLSFDKPIAQFDLKDSLSGFYYPSPGLLELYSGITFYLGENTGIVNTYIDSTVIPGVTYYYAVCAYDGGVEALDIFPEENSKFIYRSNTGEIITDVNTGYITPGRRPIGYIPAAATELEKSSSFIGTGSGFVEIIDDAAIKEGYNYEVVFKDTALQGYTESWSLLDMNTPDTVYISAINQTYIVNPMDSVAIPSGIDTILVNNKKVRVIGGYYKASYDTIINHSTRFLGNTPIVHGVRLQLYNDAVIKIDTSKSKFENTNSVNPLPVVSTNVFKSYAGDEVRDGIAMPYDYVFEFYNAIVDTSVADTLYRGVKRIILPPKEANFKVKNLTTNKYIDYVYNIPASTSSTTHNVWFKEKIDTVVKRTWQISFLYYYDANLPLEQEGTYSFYTYKPFNSKDKFTFTVKAPILDNDVAKEQLDRIKVVPNPYVVTHEGEQRLLSTQTSGRGEREIRFTYIPPGSKVTIYTVRGQLIKTLYHDDLFVGDLYWNLRTEENLDVAYGVYVYVVEVPNVGTKIDKFALIK
ncbi:MAG: hypothetical protein JW866_05820 [Ignavibacteriales bacterium]|nr:hypothetical protein [Ignavibacteriales bacterium]